MRRVRYQVASSLDGYIAGPRGEFDWIVDDPEIDLTGLYDEFDTLLMGRETYEVMLRMGQGFSGKEVVVCSRTLRQEDHPDVTVIGEDVEERVREMREGSGRDIWLFGGGELFRSLLAAGVVDTVEPAIIPILLGGGIQLLPDPAARARLKLQRHRVYPSGIVLLEYAVDEVTQAA